MRQQTLRVPMKTSNCSFVNKLTTITYMFPSNLICYHIAVLQKNIKKCKKIISLQPNVKKCQKIPKIIHCIFITSNSRNTKNKPQQNHQVH